MVAELNYANLISYYPSYDDTCQYEDYIAFNPKPDKILSLLYTQTRPALNYFLGAQCIEENHNVYGYISDDVTGI